MTQQECRGWLIVASLFIVLLLVFGSGYNTVTTTSKIRSILPTVRCSNLSTQTEF